MLWHCAYNWRVRDTHDLPDDVPGLKRLVWDRDNWTCVDCGGHTDLSVDHKIPVAAGGTNDIDNLQTMCRPCNSRKGAKV